MKQAIICVDDEDIILEALKDQLGPFFENQYLIETSTTAEEALEIYDELVESGYNVPVVISDYLMPGMRGDEFLIKVHAKNPHTLKILLTGHANIEGITNAINKANLYRYIPKPWDRDDLILTVREAVRSFLQEEEIKKKNEELQSINENLEKLVEERTSELEEANATKDKFFSIIAHDMKDHFSGLLGYTEVLSTDFERFPDEEKKTIISTIRNVSEQTYKLLQNLLEWANIQTGNMPFKPEQFPLTAFILDEMTLLQEYSGKKHQTLDFKPTNETIVYADESMISSVMRNLVGNAVKFTPENGNIVITTARKDSKAIITIQDNGVGITPENLVRLFKVNESVKTYGTNQEDGTGLGLILCREFIKKNGGEIAIDSKKGVGTTVSFTIPLLG
ncbi:MAG: hybrid sensor histidine kinase/response regulator [Bacteroidota bacterium]|nr:hybrid sensor histidine kinase/response regulator [Bacteroidota bacterium]